MPTLADLFDPTALADAIDGGYVRVQHHPSLPLRVLNYTEKAAYENAWTDVTLACRGLIVADDGRIVARPLPKFFNYGQPGGPSLDPLAAVHVTDKYDGCFPRNTALNLWGGGTITIDKLVRDRLQVTLVGMDERGNLVPALVTGWHQNGRKDNWLDIEVDARVSRRTGAAGLPNRLRVTTNHQIAVASGYRPASAIRVGDTLITQGWAPDANVLRLIRAALLGDGCVIPSATKPFQARYQEPHTAKHAEYVLALRKALGDCAATRVDSTSGFGSRMMWAGSREYRALAELRSEFYPGGIKRVPADLSWVDDFAVAKWLMDDGERQRFARQADRIAFSTHSFPESDIKRLGDRLVELYGISYHLINDSGRGLKLVINSGRHREIDNMWARLAPHVHPSMRYKIPEQYLDAPWYEPTPGRELTIPVETKVLSVTPIASTKRNFPSGRTGYDVTTTTGNYLARGVLVHNSLGVVYPVEVGWAVATRGSFASDQALHASAVLRSRYSAFVPPDGLTVLVEIIYPANRIVVDYGALDDLVLLGAVDIASGRTFGPEAVPGWPGPVVPRFDHATLADALAAPPRAGAEGVVVWFPDTDTRVKIKYEEYVRLHRIVTGLNARVVWEVLAAGGTETDAIADLPDEFHDWVRAVARELTATVEARATEVEAAYATIVAGLPEGWVRRDFALMATKHPDRGPLFLRLDGRDYRPQLWQQARPAADWAPAAAVAAREE